LVGLFLVDVNSHKRRKKEKLTKAIQFLLFFWLMQRKPSQEVLEAIRQVNSEEDGVC